MIDDFTDICLLKTVDEESIESFSASLSEHIKEMANYAMEKEDKWKIMKLVNYANQLFLVSFDVHKDGKVDMDEVNPFNEIFAIKSLMTLGCFYLHQDPRRKSSTPEQ